MIHKIASALNGMEYGRSIPKEILAQAKANGIVIVYGASDDLMEFEGAIRDELGVYNGGTAYVAKNGIVNIDEDMCKRCPHMKKSMQECKTIEAVWNDEGDYAWTYKTDIPHAEFDVLEEGEKYCQGIVFALDSLDVKPKAMTPLTLDEIKERMGKPVWCGGRIQRWGIVVNERFNKGAKLLSIQFDYGWEWLDDVIQFTNGHIYDSQP